MAQQSFERIEKKFLLTESQLQAILPLIREKMEADEYTDYTITNIYFDTDSFQLIRSSLEKPKYKEKFRLRAYGVPEEDSRVYLELKKKYRGIVYKRRTELSMREARAYLYEGKYPEKDSQVMREIDYTVRRYELKPKAFLAYDREAWKGKEDPELRLTFDRNIRGRAEALELTRGDRGIHILPEGSVLMEAKIPGAMPLWMSRAFSEQQIFMTSFSKYGSFYSQQLAEGLLRSIRLHRLRERQQIKDIVHEGKEVRNYA